MTKYVTSSQTQSLHSREPTRGHTDHTKLQTASADDVWAKLTLHFAMANKKAIKDLNPHEAALGYPNSHTGQLKDSRWTSERKRGETRKAACHENKQVNVK